ncbi:MAG TPA: GPW/gp25 family protein [Anaerolineae bacterium]
MNTPRYRAWRFLYPDVDAGAESAGLALSARGRIEMVQDNDSVRQAILLLLSTVPGERVMRPDYGSSLHQLVFSPNDDTTAGLAIYSVRRALELWEPRIDILGLDARRDEESPERLDIILDYRVRATLRSDTLALSFNLAGGLS